VEELRIELSSKCFDLLLVNNVGSAGEALPDVEIIEIEPIVVAEFRHGQCLSSSCSKSHGGPGMARREGDAGNGVEQRTLTPSILVRIQVPQPKTSLILPGIFSFRTSRNGPDTSAP
jgi:hypothetical protein